MFKARYFLKIGDLGEARHAFQRVAFIPATEWRRRLAHGEPAVGFVPPAAPRAPKSGLFMKGGEVGGGKEQEGMG